GRQGLPEPHQADWTLLQRERSQGTERHAGLEHGGGRRPRLALRGALGAPAVIDKDLTSALLASELEYENLLILTAVPRVLVNFRKPNQRELETVTASELETLRGEGHFAEGSMGPKVKAALNFIAAGGKRAIIAHLDQAPDALAGKAGTHVVA